MQHELQHIRHPSELVSLSMQRKIWPRTPPRVRLDAEGASPERVRAWESQLSRLQSACGCEQGAIGLLAGLGAYFLFLLLRFRGWEHPGRKEFWIGLAVVTSTTSLGKLIGLLLARRRLKHVIMEIQGQWRVQPQYDHRSTDTAVRVTGPQVGSTRCCGERPTKVRGA